MTVESKPTCFIIMPITTPREHLETHYENEPDHFLHVMEELFVPAITDAGLEPIRPYFRGSPLILEEIIRNLIHADLVLADVSSQNPNVFLELGIRTAQNRPAALVRDHHSTVIPFDIGPVSMHTYDGRLYGPKLIGERRAITEHVRATLDLGDHNPLWRRFSLYTISQDDGADATQAEATEPTPPPQENEGTVLVDGFLDDPVDPMMVAARRFIIEALDDDDIRVRLVFDRAIGRITLQVFDPTPSQSELLSRLAHEARSRFGVPIALAEERT